MKNALTEDEKKAATFWAGGQGAPLPAGVWINVLLAYLPDKLPTEPHAERTLALATVAMSDAGVASWDAKFTYWDPRPQNGVRDAGVDKAWTPFIDTPFFPSYISGHATYSGAAAEVLSYHFPGGRSRLPGQGPGGVELPALGRHPLAVGQRDRDGGGHQGWRPGGRAGQDRRRWHRLAGG